MANLLARSLRRHMTDAERKLWSMLRRRQRGGHRFRRQHPIGPYVVDFVCHELKLVIEVDGGQHAEDRPQDRERAWFLERRGFRAIRFWNSDVLRNLDAVVEMTEAALGEAPPPHPPPRFARGRGQDRA